MNHWTLEIGRWTITLILVGTILLSSINAANAVEVKANGEVRVRGIYSNNLSDGHTHQAGAVCRAENGELNASCDDQEAFSDIRFRSKITLAEGETAGVVVLDLLSQEGEDISTLSSSDAGEVETGNWRLGTEGFGEGIDSVVLREAYLRHTFSWASFILGRQPIHLGHGIILDDRADGLVMTIPNGPVGITIANLRLVEANSPGSSGGKADLYFTHLAWAPNPNVVWGAFVSGLVDRRPDLIFKGTCRDPGSPLAPIADPPSHQRCAFSDLGNDFMRLFVGGITFDGGTDEVRVGLELDLLKGSIDTRGPTLLNPTGRDLNLAGFNMLVTLDYPLSFMDLAFTGIYSSGQDISNLPELGGKKLNINAISPNFVLGNILVNNEINSDREGGNIGGMKAIRLGFKRPLNSEIQGEFAVIWAQLTERPAPNIDRDLGLEFDINTYYDVTNHLRLVSNIGILLAGDGWQGIYGDPGADDTQIKMLTKVVYSF